MVYFYVEEYHKSNFHTQLALIPDQYCSEKILFITPVETLRLNFPVL